MLVDRDDEYNAEHRSRAVELALVLIVTVAPSLFQSTIEAISSYELYRPIAAYSLYAVLRSMSSVALVVYVLARSHRTIADIGVKFAPRDLFRSVGIWCAGMAAYYSSFYGVTTLVHSFWGIWCQESTRNVSLFYNAHGAGLIAVLAYAIAGPIFEEIVVRAYLQTEVAYLLRSPLIAMLTSIALQTSYHFYQGWFAALVLDMPLFIVFAIYYMRTKNVVPIIIAHVAIDIWSVLLHR